MSETRAREAVDPLSSSFICGSKIRAFVFSDTFSIDLSLSLSLVLLLPTE